MKTRTILGAGAAALALSVSAGGAQAQILEDTMLGEIRMFGFNFCPQGWLRADGQIEDVREYPSLASLYYDAFGGDMRRNTFGLPNVQGRRLVGVGPLPDYPYEVRLGAMAGGLSDPLSIDMMPAHTHTAEMVAEEAIPMSNTPEGSALPQVAQGIFFVEDGSIDQKMATDSVKLSATGGGDPFDYGDPYLGLTFCVASDGNYPQRN